MKTHVTITGNNIDKYIQNYAVLAFSLRNSRIKAKQLAIMEAYLVLLPLNGIFIKNGPLGNIKGVFSFFIPREYLDKMFSILPTIGYCNKFYLLDFHTNFPVNNSDISNINELVWKGRTFNINNFYFQDRKIYQEHSSNNRKFVILNQKEEKEVYGYRGDGTELGRRALPVEDARCLVNLSLPCYTERLLDPFAGAGGIVYEAKYINKEIEVFSIDKDPVLAPGLEYYGSRHYIGNSANIDFDEEFFDAIVTEVPFSSKALDDIVQTIRNISSSLKKDGRIVMMCSIKQSPVIRKVIGETGFYEYVFQEVNRKGTNVAIMAWCKSYEKFKEIESLTDTAGTVF